MTPDELVALVAAEPLPADAVERAAEAAGAAEAEVRSAALDALGRMTAFRSAVIPSGVMRRIVDCTGDPDHRVRAEAASCIAMMPEPPESGLAAVRALLEDPHSRVRQEACAALGDLRDRAARDAIAERLDDQDPQVGFEAAFALGTLQDTRARPPLERALADTRLRLDACEALRRLGDQAAVGALEKLLGKLFLPWADKLTIAATLFALGEVSYAARILERTRARGREERTYALSLIGSHRIRDGRGILETVALDTRDPLRETAVRALGALGDREVIPSLERVATEADPELAGAATEALAQLVEPGAS